MDDLLVTGMCPRCRSFAVSVDFAEISAFDTVEPYSELSSWEMLVLLNMYDALDDLSGHKPDVVAQKFNEN